MSEITINAKRRTLSSKSAITKLRRDGEVPGIYYAKGIDPIPLTLPEISLKPLVYTSETHIVNLKVDGSEEKKSILKNIQFDPVTDRVIHFDLLGISLDKEIEIEVPVMLVGSAKGVKEGGIIQHTMHKLNISCLPGNIPEHINIDITELALGDSVHIGNLKYDNIKFLQNEDVIIVSVVTPRAVQEPTPAETTGEEITEPEVISKGKAETEEE
jgi:large subunit ribosomal protein L25